MNLFRPTILSTVNRILIVDGIVDVNDFLMFLSNYNERCTILKPCDGNVNNDGIVDINDYLILLGDFNKKIKKM